MEKRFKLAHQNVNHHEPAPITLRCPECHRLGTLDTFTNIKDYSVAVVGEEQPRLILGHRLCPNPSCRLLIHIVYSFMRTGKTQLFVSYPTERIDFEASSIPGPIVNALEEAITCHAQGCFFAAAIMVRKSLEELCRHQGVAGKTLADQIRDLKTKVIVPVGLLDGIDVLRLLGNDAAHVVLKDFDEIGPEEVEVGILFSKELLKAVYQSAMLADRLKALRK